MLDLRRVYNTHAHTHIHTHKKQNKKKKLDTERMLDLRRSVCVGGGGRHDDSPAYIGTLSRAKVMLKAVAVPPEVRNIPPPRPLVFCLQSI